ncbi:MAG: hypothetical protein CVT92_08520 [Bacteroidetes bacterium HGW-Bacteroidetes-1]|jgi:hypothetical protein|nr:MAG: hypothetical protein CVT92_08520 [Bacteroidetes bacterium HGW-Bacteroidetes-1]
MPNKRFKIIFLLLILTVPGQIKCLPQTPEHEKLTGFIGLDLASKYIWRGLKLSEGPVIQSNAELFFRRWNFGIWSLAGFSAKDCSEIDIYLSYTYKNFSLTLNDYFMFNDSMVPSYTNYNKNETNHVIETIIEYSGSDSFPFRLTAGLNFFGDISNSTYFEAVWLTNAGETEIELLAGLSPQKGYYDENKSGLNNMGGNFIRRLTINDTIILSLKFSCIYAPFIDELFIVTTLGLN